MKIVDNYKPKPIPITNVISKITHKFLKYKIMSFLLKHKISYNSYNKLYGLQGSKFATEVLIDIEDQIYDIIINKKKSIST